MKLKISHNLEVEGATPEFVDAACSALTIKNPSYERVVRVSGSRWAAAEYFKYYKKRKDRILELPRGFEERAIKWLEATKTPYELEYNVVDKKLELYGMQEPTLRDYQEPLVEAMVEAKGGGVVVASTGAGKTYLTLESIRRQQRSSLIIVPTGVIQTQFVRTAKDVFGVNLGIINGKEKTVKDVTVAMWQSLANNKELLAGCAERFSHIYIDECFSGKTKVMTSKGRIKIKNIMVGDEVLTPKGYKKVIRTQKSKSFELFRISWGGQTYTVTKNHPFLTSEGWKKAEDLGINSVLLTQQFVYDTLSLDIDSLTNKYGNTQDVFRVWETILSTEEFKPKETLHKEVRMGMGGEEQGETREVLENHQHPGIQGGCVSKGKRLAQEEPPERKGFCEEDDGEQPHEKPGNQKEGVRDLEENWSQPKDTGRKRKGGTTTAKNSLWGTWKRLAHRISCANQEGKRQWIPNLLQNRYCKSKNKNWGRGGRRKPLPHQKAGAGQEKNRPTYGYGVENIQIQKQGGFGRHSKSATVYNLEVEGCPVYTVGGVVVHNCHGVVSDVRSETLRAFKPSKLYGLSGSPRRAKDDGRTKAIFFMLGEVICEYKATQLNPRVEIVDTGINIPVLDYHEMIDIMVQNKVRNKLIGGLCLGEVFSGKKVLVLTKRIEHYEKLRELMPDSPNFYYISSKDKNKEELLMELSSGDREFNAIFGTVSLLATGLDIPSLDRLIIACDMKSDVMVQQGAGRVLRLFEGKEDPLIYDLHDDKNPILHKHYVARRKFYNEQGWQVTDRWS